jgi:hypothetical protein
VRIIEYLFSLPGPTGPWSGVLFGAFVALALGIGFLAAVMYELNARHVLNRNVARKIFFWGAGLQLLGLLILGFRVLNWPVVSLRIFLYLLLAGEAFAAGYLWWWVKNRYPALLSAYEMDERRRAYLPRAAGGMVEPARRRPAARRRR